MGVGRRDPLRVRTGSSRAPAALAALRARSGLPGSPFPPCQAPAQVQTPWASPQSPCCKHPGPVHLQSTTCFPAGLDFGNFANAWLLVLLPVRRRKGNRSPSRTHCSKSADPKETNMAHVVEPCWRGQRPWTLACGPGK